MMGFYRELSIGHVWLPEDTISDKASSFEVVFF